MNAEWLDFDKRQQKTFKAAEFFVYKFLYLFQDMNMNRLSEQFIAYQVLSDTDILLPVKTYVGLEPDDPYRVDDLWAYWTPGEYLKQICLYFELLFKVTAAVLAIPHSNASEERNIFPHKQE